MHFATALTKSKKGQLHVEIFLSLLSDIVCITVQPHTKKKGGGRVRCSHLCKVSGVRAAFEALWKYGGH